MKSSALQIKLNIINLLLGAGLYSSIEVIYLKSKDFSSYTISFLLLLIPLATAVLEVPTGILGDYLGRKKVFRLTFLSFFCSMIIIFFANNLFSFILAYLIEALGYSFYSGNTEAILYEQCRKEGRNVNKSLSNFYASLTIGYVISGVMVKIFSYWNDNILKLSIVLTIIIRFIAVALCFSIYKINDIERKKKPVLILKEAFKYIKNDKTSISICIYDALGRLQYYLPVIYQPILLNRGISISSIAVIYSLSQLAQSISQKIAAPLIEKFGMSKIVKIGPIIQGSGLLLLLVDDSYVIIAGVILVYSCISIKGQCTSLIRNKITSDETRVTFSSLISLVTLLINTLLLNGIGIIIERALKFAIVILSVIIVAGSFAVENNFVGYSENNKMKDGEIGLEVKQN